MSSTTGALISMCIGLPPFHGGEEARTELLELMLCIAPKGSSQEPVSRLPILGSPPRRRRRSRKRSKFFEFYELNEVPVMRAHHGDGL